MTQDHARHGLDFEVLQTVFLLAGKIADLFLGKSNIIQITRGDAIHGLFDLRRAKEKLFGFPIVEFF